MSEHHGILDAAKIATTPYLKIAETIERFADNPAIQKMPAPEALRRVARALRNGANSILEGQRR